MKSPVVIKNNLKTPEKNGTYWRLICLNGPNKGITYYLNGKRLILGRSEKVDITIEDKKTSREHAELVKLKDNYVISDLNSQNGIIINKEKVQQHELGSGDRIQIGRTVYKYEILDVKNPLAALDDFIDKRDDEEEDDDELDESLEKKGKRKNKLFIGLGLILAVLFLMEESPQGRKSKKDKSLEAKSEKFNNLTEKKDEMDSEIEEKLVTLIQRGLREYREQNYFRAINEFNLALILKPSHGRASFYLRRTKQRLDEEIQINFLRAKRERDALKYNAAIVSTCAIVKLLEGYEEDERYIEASNNIKELEKLMGYEEGEAKCLQK